MDLFLVRHGNTFEAGERSYFVGSKEDLELTGEGVAQAGRLAEVLSEFKIDRVCCGSLKRQLGTAEPIAGALRLAVKVEAALNELNYGVIGGKSNDELSVEESKAHTEFVERGIWPFYVKDSEEERVRELSKLLKSCETQTSVLVTSGGILQMIYKMLFPESYSKEAKVKTGAYCQLEFNGSWSQVSWNTRP